MHLCKHQQHPHNAPSLVITLEANFNEHIIDAGVTLVVHECWFERACEKITKKRPHEELLIRERHFFRSNQRRNFLSILINRIDRDVNIELLLPMQCTHTTATKEKYSILNHPHLFASKFIVSCAIAHRECQKKKKLHRISRERRRKKN